MANYYVLLTDYGRNFIANAQASTQLALTNVVLGDANNQPYLPDSRLNKTKLVNQVATLPIASITVINDSTAEIKAVVPSTMGGFNLHEVGITDSSNKLVYIGNFHGGYRPTLTEGAGGDIELVFTITANNLANVVIEMDGTTAAASRGWVNERLQLLCQALFTYGYKYWSHTPDSPKPIFDELLGEETFWRRLEGVHLIAVADAQKPISYPMSYVGNNGNVTLNNDNPDHYQGYTSYLWERYDPDNDLFRYDGKTKLDGSARFL